LEDFYQIGLKKTREKEGLGVIAKGRKSSNFPKRAVVQVGKLQKES
jgi:hypothetical protein